MSTILSQNNWRAEFIYNGKSYGFFNRGELKFGSQADVITDPEEGQVLLGGRQTAENVDITRPWKLVRDTEGFRGLKALRGRGSGELILHELDPDTLQPTSSTPLDVLSVKLIEVVVPASDADGNGASMFTASLAVKA